MADVRVGYCQSYPEMNKLTLRTEEWLHIANQGFLKSIHTGFSFDVRDDIKLRNHVKIWYFKMKMPLKMLNFRKEYSQNLDKSIKNKCR